MTIFGRHPVSRTVGNRVGRAALKYRTGFKADTRDLLSLSRRLPDAT